MAVWSAYRCLDGAAARGALRTWYEGELGRRLLEREQEQLAQALGGLFGYHLVQLGVPADADLLAASRIPHRVVLGEAVGHEYGVSWASGIRCEATALPVSGASLDVVVLPHTLEFERDPHQVLREVERVLIPEGHLVVLGFNPWSLWGARRALAGWRGRSPWCGRFLSLARLKDWLALLGFDTVLTRSYFFRPPLGHAGLLEWCRFLERAGGRWWPSFGGGYLLVVRKRVATLTPIKPRWRTRRIVTGRITEPTVGG